MAQKGKNATKLAKFWNGRRGWIASSGLRSSHAPTIHCLPTSGETSNSNSISVLLFLGQKTIFPSSYTATILMARLKLPVAFENESPEEFEPDQARGGPPTIHHRYIMRNTSQFYGVKKKEWKFLRWIASQGAVHRLSPARSLSSMVLQRGEEKTWVQWNPT